MATSKPKSGASNPSFSTQLEELENIIRQFETEEIELEESVQAFEKGMHLLENLRDQLQQAENKVEIIKKKFARP